MEVVDFFERSAGRWRSQRTTHHLAFRRAEVGDSEISVIALAASDPEVRELCQFHNVDPDLAVCGSRVAWQGTMGWDRDSEGGHEGKTVFAIVPDRDEPSRGRLLRERGYAEIMPVVGRYHLDAEGGLNLTTEYETMSSIERFWFATPTLRLRTSTVKRFGGFSTASFCSEARLALDRDEVLDEHSSVAETSKPARLSSPLSAFGW
ncbi:phycobiliprotein lyase [Altericista sp. CCNU0014]|uniref:phycobiliprotein lyase n=1 Tax=Altericista sp. CCNU0014 TaxID=3082949 RepID=UPI00384D74DA